MSEEKDVHNTQKKLKYQKTQLLAMLLLWHVFFANKEPFTQ